MSLSLADVLRVARSGHLWIPAAVISAGFVHERGAGDRAEAEAEQPDGGNPFPSRICDLRRSWYA
jgi:hypothetical protein